MKKMTTIAVALLAALVIAGHNIPCGLASPSTVPAFLWSPHLPLASNSRLKDAVNYQTIFPKELAKSVLSEGGWSNMLCSGDKLQQPVHLALVFVGSELQSSDISLNKHGDSTLVEFLKGSFTKSNFSMAFPYVVASGEETMENSLLSGFTETCVHDLGISNVGFMESCSAKGENFQTLADLQSAHDYVVSRAEKRPKGQADLLVFCHGGSHSMKEVDQPRSESDVFSNLIHSVEQSGAKYSVLYVSDPLRSIQYPSHRELERFLAEGTLGNESTNSVCDEVCRFKSSLLEGVLVGIVLLIILISGLCCMMGIDTPTRFEALQDS